MREKKPIRLRNVFWQLKLACIFVISLCETKITLGILCMKIKRIQNESYLYNAVDKITGRSWRREFNWMVHISVLLCTFLFYNFPLLFHLFLLCSFTYRIRNISSDSTRTMAYKLKHLAENDEQQKNKITNSIYTHELKHECII